MNHLKNLRAKKQVSQQEISCYLGITRQAYSNYENGNRSPDNETLLKLAEYFDTSVDVILRGEEKKSFSSSKSGPWIPVLGRVQAGIPVEAVEDIIDYEQITTDMAEQGEYFALQIHGESMEPRFAEGDVVIVRKQTCVESGDIGVVLVNGDEATIKKIKKGPEGLMLIPSNPAYEPMFYSNEEIEKKPVRILGKVVELRAKF